MDWSIIATALGTLLAAAAAAFLQRQREIGKIQSDAQEWRTTSQRLEDQHREMIRDLQANTRSLLGIADRMNDMAVGIQVLLRAKQ